MRTRYRLLLLVAAFLFSTGGTAIKACALTSWQIACFRSGIAALTVAILLPEARKIRSWRVLLIGTSFAATLVLFVLATKLTTSAQAIFLQATSPLYLLFLAPVVLKERIRWSDYITVGIVVAGAVLLLFGEQRIAVTAPDPLHGNVLAALSGFAWALTITGLRWLARRGTAESPAAVAVSGNLIAFAVCLPMALPVLHVTVADAAVIGYLGVVQIGLAYMLLTRSIHHVPAVQAATLLLLEPVLNPVWTWLIQGERVSATTLLGGVLIVAALLGSTVWQARESLSTSQ